MLIGPAGGSNLAGAIMAIRQQAEAERRARQERQQQIAATAMGGVNTLMNVANTANNWLQPFLQRDFLEGQQGRAQEWGTKERLGSQDWQSGEAGKARGWRTGEREAEQSFQIGPLQEAILQRIRANSEGEDSAWTRRMKEHAIQSQTPVIESTLGPKVATGDIPAERYNDAIEALNDNPNALNLPMLAENYVTSKDTSKKFGTQGMPNLFQGSPASGMSNLEELKSIREGAIDLLRPQVDKSILSRLGEGVGESPVYKGLQPSPMPTFGETTSPAAATPYPGGPFPTQQKSALEAKWKAEEERKAALLQFLQQYFQMANPVGPPAP